jgi:hypothetical protein
MWPGICNETEGHTPAKLHAPSAHYQFWALGFSGNRRKGYAVENLPGGLKTETVRYKLSVAGEFKMEIPARMRI